jgi:hypothetical protein
MNRKTAEGKLFLRILFFCWSVIFVRSAARWDSGPYLGRVREGKMGRLLSGVVTTEDPRPFFGAFTKAFSDGIHSDVAHLFDELMMVSQAMVEKVLLPGDGGGAC